jgi:hypothetical protein
MAVSAVYCKDMAVPAVCCKDMAVPAVYCKDLKQYINNMWAKCRVCSVELDGTYK